MVRHWMLTTLAAFLLVGAQTASAQQPTPAAPAVPPAPQSSDASASDTEAPVAEPWSYAVARLGAVDMQSAYRVFVAVAQEHGRLQPSPPAASMAFPQLRQSLIGICVIPDNWDFGPQDCLRRDTLAYMSASYLGCRPGLFTGLLGMTRRYAHREMVHQEILSAGFPGRTVTGSEFLSVVTRISQRIQGSRGANLRADEIH